MTHDAPNSGSDSAAISGPDAAPDPFDALGIAPAFDLDRAQIAGAYAARVARVHPDLADPEKADAAQRAAAALNDARAALDDPERRAIALLTRLGGPRASDDRSLPDGFLMEMMEVRQQAEDECVTRDGHDRWRAWADERRAERIEEVGALFARALADEPGRAGVLIDVRRALNAWRYIERMLEQLDPDAVDPM